jgi:cytochrome P450
MNISVRPHNGCDTPLGAIDVSDPAIYQQDIWQPLFARLRREAPVHYCTESRYGPYWSVTRYNDIMAVELDHATYSSQLGGGLQIEDLPADMERRSFIRMDPPRHTGQREAVAPVAAPNNLESYAITIRERTRAVLDRLPRNASFDWVGKVSIELTTMIFATCSTFLGRRGASSPIGRMSPFATSTQPMHPCTRRRRALRSFCGWRTPSRACRGSARRCPRGST